MKYLLLILSLGLSIPSLFAQHEHHDMSVVDTTKRPTTATPKKDTVHKAPPHNHDNMDMKMKIDSVPKKPAPDMNTQMSNHHHDEMEMSHEHHDMSMSHSFSKNLPMNRNGSGTAWAPDYAPMYGYMFHTRNWMYMVHGSAFLRYNKQDLLNNGSRGDKKFDAPNMVMFMGQRNVGKKGLFHFSTMLSLDPLTVGKSGYPLLFQTGESFNGKPLVDRQHPHDLFSEMSVSYAYALSTKSDLFVYLGYPGEPALGPVAYVHRPSGMFNPDAPLTHHWTDATHISFGVATLGFRYNKWKIEGSSFTGREPNEMRYDFDKPRFDSWSGRLSYNPTEKWALQVSRGFLKSPEEVHPNEDVNRTTASASFSSRGFGERFINLTALWGRNKTKDHDGENGILMEGTYASRRYAVYGRYEWVQKSIEELNLSEALYGHDAIFPVHAFTAGASRDLFTIGQTKIALGGQFTFYNPDKRLASLYGQNPLAGELYLRISPRAMGSKMGSLYLPQ
jgi:hypothetical protein